MNESAILDTLKAIENSIGTIAGLAIATFMIGVALFSLKKNLPNNTNIKNFLLINQPNVKNSIWKTFRYF